MVIPTEYLMCSVDDQRRLAFLLLFCFFIIKVIQIHLLQHGTPVPIFQASPLLLPVLQDTSPSDHSTATPRPLRSVGIVDIPPCVVGVVPSVVLPRLRLSFSQACLGCCPDPLPPLRDEYAPGSPVDHPRVVLCLKVSMAV